MFPPNTDPQIFCITASVIGAILSPQFTINEANTIGNFLVLVGDYMITYAGQATLIVGRENIPDTTNDTMETIKKALQKMEEELEKIKN